MQKEKKRKKKDSGLKLTMSSQTAIVYPVQGSLASKTNLSIFRDGCSFVKFLQKVALVSQPRQMHHPPSPPTPLAMIAGWGFGSEFVENSTVNETTP